MSDELRFVQITCSVSRTKAGTARDENLYGLDADGIVWWFDYDASPQGWRRLSMRAARTGGADET